MTAAMKKVLSPISETNIMPQDFRNPAVRPPASRLVMLSERDELPGLLGTRQTTSHAAEDRVVLVSCARPFSGGN